MPVVGYARVSTVMQAQDGISLDTQRKRIEQWADFKGKPLRGLFVDEGVSGKSMAGREQLRAALAALQKGDSFVVYDLSRLSRSTGDSLAILDQIQTKNCDFVSIGSDIDTTTPAGKMMFTMLSAFNALEREQTAAKVSDNMQRLSADGKLGKKAMWGWRWVKKGEPFEPVPEQQAVIEHVRQMMLKDASLNVQRVVDWLNADEASRAAMKGKRFYYRTVRQWMVENDILPESDKVKKRRGLQQKPAAAAAITTASGTARRRRSSPRTCPSSS